MKKKYTKDELIKKFNGKYIDTYRTYDHIDKQWLYEVRSVKSKIWENHNLPEDEIAIN